MDNPRINIRNTNKLISKRASSDQIIKTPSKIYCEMCGNESTTEQEFCKNCGTQLHVDISIIDILNEKDDLIKKCESSIEERFFRVARKLIPDIKPQEPIGQYRVDFAVIDKRVVVELDGHEYHKSKEQRTNDAERQRFLQKKGYTVIRFTGNEINKDVNGCVSEVLDILEEKK